MERLPIKIKNLHGKTLQVKIDKDKDGGGSDSFFNVPNNNDLKNAKESTWTRRLGQKLQIWVRDPTTQDYDVTHFDTEDETITIGADRRITVVVDKVSIKVRNGSNRKLQVSIKDESNYKDVLPGGFITLSERPNEKYKVYVKDPATDDLDVRNFVAKNTSLVIDSDMHVHEITQWIGLKTWRNTYLSVTDNNAVKQDANLKQRETLGRVDHEGKVAFLTSGDTYLSGGDDNSVKAVTTLGLTEWFRLIDTNGRVSLRTRKGQFISAWDDGSTNQQNHMQRWEEYDIVKV